MYPDSTVVHMTGPEAVVVLGIVDGVISTITQSWYLSAIAVAIILSIALSILSGLIDIAAYLTMLAVVVLIVLGVLNHFAPGLVPIIATPAVSFEFANVDSLYRLAQTVATPLLPNL